MQGQGMKQAIEKLRLYNSKTQSVALKKLTRDLKCKADKGDQKQLWKAARRLAPWKPKEEANIRGKDGQRTSCW